MSMSIIRMSSYDAKSALEYLTELNKHISTTKGEIRKSHRAIFRTYQVNICRNISRYYADSHKVRLIAIVDILDKELAI